MEALFEKFDALSGKANGEATALSSTWTSAWAKKFSGKDEESRTPCWHSSRDQEECDELQWIVEEGVREYPAEGPSSTLLPVSTPRSVGTGSDDKDSVPLTPRGASTPPESLRASSKFEGLGAAFPALVNG